MRARFNRDIEEESTDYAPSRIVAYKGTEGEVRKNSDKEDPYDYVFYISDYHKIWCNRHEFDFIDPLDDLIELVREIEK